MLSWKSRQVATIVPGCDGTISSRCMVCCSKSVRYILRKETIVLSRDSSLPLSSYISQEALQLDYLSAMGPLIPFVVSSSQGKGYYRRRFRVCSMDVMFANASNQNLAPQIIVGSTAVFGDDNFRPHFVCIVCIYHHPGIERRLHLPVPPLGCVRGEPTSRTR